MQEEELLNLLEKEFGENFYISTKKTTIQSFLLLVICMIIYLLILKLYKNIY